MNKFLKMILICDIINVINDLVQYITAKCPWSKFLIVSCNNNSFKSSYDCPKFVLICVYLSQDSFNLNSKKIFDLYNL